MPQKRSQPLAAPAPARSSNKGSKASRASSSPNSSSSDSPNTPALTPSSSTTPPSSLPLSLARSSKKLTKAVRQGHGYGNGGTHGGGGKGTKTRRAVADGPEAELSDAEEEDDRVSVVEEETLVVNGERVVEGIEGKSAPKSEVSMHTLLDGAKLRPEPHNISRGYELLTSPASRLVIPFDSIKPVPNFSQLPSNMNRAVHFGSAPSSPGFSDDVEWEWEDLCFEMDGVDIATNSTGVAAKGPGKKDAYAEVVKRVAVS